MNSTKHQERFTATGGPMPEYITQSVWETACPYGLQAPVFLPFRFKDDTIIPVVVRLSKSHSYVDSKSMKKNSTFQRLVSHINNKTLGPPVTVVFMPRSEYHKHFAVDEKGVYIGTEPQRSWNEKELELEFGEYQDVPRKRWVKTRDGGMEYMVEED